ncbi:MAG TPA: beta-ketoacyl synthase N-terminal-like domain-containing protein [Candidatus Polarisedimenticolaceae bacterium]|nr:beta-ketoacyl synthase N-terminal-like domain-containing protein [Candidatus Polarisedimenticolaceae bacterium]
MSRAVVATGIGTIGAHGAGRERLAEALAAGRPLAMEIDRSGGWHSPAGSRYAALAPVLDLTPWLPSAQARRLGRPSRFALVAARMAIEDAGIPALDGLRVAVVLATSFGAVAFTEKLVEQILIEGPEAAQPFYFSECVANAAAAQVAIGIKATGANVTLTQREAGPVLALARGAREVAEGRADVAIVGATDEMTPLLHGLLDRFHATARAEDGRDEAARPFDGGRNGFLAGEGASAIVLEAEEAARRRGARPLARVGRTASGFDPTATASDWGHGGASLGRRLAAMLDGQAPLESIDRIVSGASGSRRGDRLEAATLRAAWSGRSLPPVVTPKAVIGEYGGGILAAGALAASGARFGFPTAWMAPDPEMTISPHDGSPLDAPRRVLLTGLAAGGAAAWAVLERI